MTDAADPVYTLEERGAVNPRRVVMFASPTRYTSKGLVKNTDGILEIVGDPADVVTVKLDFSLMLEDDERILHAEVGGAVLQNAIGKYLLFSVADFSACGRTVTVGVVFSTGDRQMVHFIAKADPAARRGVLATQPEDVREESAEATTPIPSIWGGVEW